jgi:hypothetical protein
MKTTRSLVLVAASALGISLLVAPLGYAAEGPHSATSPVASHSVSMAHRGHVTKHKKGRHRRTQKQHRRMKTATQTIGQSVSLALNL